MSEVTVTQPPAPKPPAPALKPAAKDAIASAVNANVAATSGATGASGASSDGNEISVYLSGNRLRVTANVDDKGLEKLEQALSSLRGVLRMLQ